MGLGYNQVGILIQRVIDFSRKRKRVNIAELASELGYRSPEYFRRSQWRLVKAKLGDCIEEIDGWNYEWICGEGKG